MDIRLHPAYEAAITRIEDLKLTLATAYSRLSGLQTTQVPFTEARYMATIGRYELTAYELYMTVQFLKKRRQLMLQAINQGETPDLEAIEIARVKVGSIRLNALLSVVMTGNHPSRIDRKYINTSAAKKFGIEFPIKLKNRIR